MDRCANQPNDRVWIQTRSFSFSRRGYSLIEMLAVVVILGILAAIGAVRLAPGLKDNLATETDSFRMLMALREARSAAISTGDEHRLRLLQSGGTITGYQIERLGGSTTVVEGPHLFSGRAAISQTGSDATFDFQGQAIVAPVLTFVGPNRTDRITVVSATGWGLLEQL
ncbi:pilus assembly FimT family protein [Bremerella sp. T1]|uniref:pilus assembly FimT family protein n=1 Tax=Bremerella sp. TYQ1 TaxID=3119568 RepID=UPI001CCB42CC|nr:prepilin-type N-terminal cleavage/methylation domain-containing protein [Bremerella volcania]UBM36564.1 prepilin-type N-terminal cleavage/methylation domain-containing protein [Bremerella volcania]